MKRQRNGYSYLRQSINYNSRILSRDNIFSRRFIYFDKKDSVEIFLITKGMNFNFFHRPSHDGLANFDRGSYAFWRAHLCLDFCYSMNQAMTESPSSYIMWLEDDTLLSPQFPNEMARLFGVRKQFHIASLYHTEEFAGCAACLIFERQALVEYINLVAGKYEEDISLDYFYKYLNYKIIPFYRKSAFHIGKYSSRIDSNITRPEQFPPFAIGEKLGMFVSKITNPKI
jgi:hypothetical protein